MLFIVFSTLCRLVLFVGDDAVPCYMLIALSFFSYEVMRISHVLIKCHSSTDYHRYLMCSMHTVFLFLHMLFFLFHIRVQCHHPVLNPCSFGPNAILPFCLDYMLHFCMDC